MRWSASNKTLWKPWFAWRPVRTTSGYFIWWEPVERRYVDIGNMEFRYVWQYREQQ